MTQRVLFVLAVALACIGTADAEVRRASSSLNEYVKIVVPGAIKAQIHMPLIASFSESGELDKLISGNVEGAPSGDEVISVLNAEGKGHFDDVGVSHERFTEVLSEALRLADTAREQKRKVVLLVRLAPPTSKGPMVHTVRDQDWESAVLRLHEKADNLDVVILSLSTN